MATTVHLPEPLLESVDQRAKELGVSRNRYIVMALERALDEDTRWSRRFLDTLASAAADTDTHRDVDEMVEAIASRRTRKAPPKL